jgi:hypothetical protein
MIMIQCNACQITHPIGNIYITNHNLDYLGREDNYHYIRSKSAAFWEYTIREHTKTKSKSMSLRQHWHLCKNEYLCPACFIIKDIIE